MRSRSLRSALTSLLVVAAPVAHAAGLAERCDDASRALLFVPLGVPEKAEAAMETELAVEARRLSLDPCRAVGGRPAVTAQVSWSTGNARLEVTVGTRILGRDVALGSDAEGDVLELALILGDLVREAVAPSTPPPAPPDSGWSVGAQADLAAFPSSASVFWGGALTVRGQWHLFAVELAAGGATTRTAQLSAGTLSLQAISGQALGLFTLLHGAHARLHVEGGLRGSALALTARANAGALASPRWAPALELRAGLALDVPLGAVQVRASVGGTFPVLGLSALADGQSALGVVGPAAFGAVGLAFGGERAP